jgi:hypothetical protein
VLSAFPAKNISLFRFKVFQLPLKCFEILLTAFFDWKIPASA